jgi:hypothetical protein
MMEKTAATAPHSVARNVPPMFEPTIRDKLAWFSPKTWWGILQLQNASSFCDFQLETFINGILGSLIPLLIVSLLCTLDIGSPHRLVPATLVSPWTIASVDTTLAELRSVRKVCNGWKKMRKQTDEEAVNTLIERIESGRAHRCPRFDLYMPLEYRGQALLFFPGACVPHTAYSEVAAQMSDNGLVVVVASMEPLCMPSAGLGADAPPMRRIIQQVDRDYLPYPAQWSLGGHSFGAFAAMRLALELDPASVVFWGAGSFLKTTTNISMLNCSVLAIQGSNDCIAKHTPESWQTFLNELPPNTTRKVIRGGTHNGFASYPGIPATDGISGITKEHQRKQTAEATSKFIFQHADRQLK